MRKIAAVITVFALLCPFALLFASASSTAELLRLTNAQRAAHGLSAVRGDHANLNAAAQLRAREAARYWSHNRPDGRSWSTVLSEFNISGYRAASENLAFTSAGTPASAIQVWMNSATHRANLLGASHTHVGLGVYFCADNERYFWAQLFLNDGSAIRAAMQFFTNVWQWFWRIVLFPVSWMF